MAVTLFYPDISAYNPGQDLDGCWAVCIKASENNNWTNDYWQAQLNEAANHGAFAFAYHFLHHGNAANLASQAQLAYRMVGPNRGLMLDVEPTTGSNPTLADIIGFVSEYRALGGKVYLVYLPAWYWAGASFTVQEIILHVINRSNLVAESIPNPDAIVEGPFNGVSLQPLINKGLLLVSSSYPASGYSDTGVGWNPYGGMYPYVWQFSSSINWQGHLLDFNAVKDTAVNFKSLVLTGKRPSPPLVSGPIFFETSGENEMLTVTRKNGTTDVFAVVGTAGYHQAVNPAGTVLSNDKLGGAWHHFIVAYWDVNETVLTVNGQANDGTIWKVVWQGTWKTPTKVL